MSEFARFVIPSLAVLVFGITAAVSGYLAPHMPLLWQITAGLSFAALVATVVLNWKSLTGYFQKRTSQYLFSSFVGGFFAIAVAVVVNLIANNHDIKKDFTKTGAHTLEEQTVKVLKGLKSPVTVKAFLDPRVMENRAQFKEFFDLYKYHSKNLNVEFPDWDKQMLLAQSMKVQGAGTLIFEGDGGRVERLENVGTPDVDPNLESKVTNALIRVTKGEKKKVYFISGHGERLPSNTEPTGLSNLKKRLEESRFQVVEKSLAGMARVPEDAEIIVSVGPKSEFLAEEVKALEDYVWRGGKFLLFLEPDSKAGLTALAAKLGVQIKPNKAVFEADPNLRAFGELAPIIAVYDRSHEITKTMQPTVFVLATPVEKTATLPVGIKTTVIASSSPMSLEVEVGKNVKVDPKKDRKGPLGVGIAVSGEARIDAPAPKPENKDEKKEEPKKPEFRVAIFGDSDFVSNAHLAKLMNSDLIENTFNWLSLEEDLIALRPKPKDEREFNLTEMRVKVITLTSVMVIPLLMLIAAFGVWQVRKKK